MRTITIPTYMFIGLMVALVLVVIIFVFAMKDGNQCLNNPLVYGAEKAMNEDIGGIMCSCQFLDSRYVPLYFNDKEMSVNPFFGGYRGSGDVFNGS